MLSDGWIEAARREEGGGGGGISASGVESKIIAIVLMTKK